MNIVQLSVFVENKVGRLRAITKVLADAGVNILTMSLADTTDFGILRFIADDPDKARNVLSDHDVMCRATDVVAVRVAHTPGALNELLGILGEEGIQIEYMYNYTELAGDGGLACVIILRLSDQANAAELLRGRGIKLEN